MTSARIGASSSFLDHTMSIEVDWKAATSGPDGEALAERIRSFIHDKFQQVPLPRFIRSVQVHSFDFGTVAPNLDIKDFCEPFADFYEEEEEDGEDEDDEENTSEVSEELVSNHPARWARTHSELNEPPSREEIASMNQHQHPHSLRDPFDDAYRQPSGLRSPMDHLNPHFLPRAGAPGIPVGTSTLGYHLMSLGGLSGTQTPLAAVAGGTPFTNNWAGGGTTDHGLHLQTPGPRNRGAHHQRSDGDIDSSNPASRPSTSTSHPSASNPNSGGSGSHSLPEDTDDHDPTTTTEHPHSHHQHNINHPLRLPRMRERKPEDFQILCHARYAGDIRLSLTAEILLDYPMPSFVGLPLKLNVTGLTFDGVAVVAYIRKRVHFCFLSSEDADAVIGSEQRQQHNQQQQEEKGAGNHGDQNQNQQRPRSQGEGGGGGGLGLLQEIRVESEIGRKEDGKQVLKNVGKVERFVLAQVRRIFEEELVYPSFWTFLV